MNNLALIIGLLATVLALLAWGVVELAQGYAHQRDLAARGVRGFGDHRFTLALDRWDARLRRTTLGRQLGRRLSASGMRLRLSLFVLALVLAGLGVIAFIGLLMSPVLGLIAAAVVGFVGLIYLRHQEDRRREEFVRQLPELARVLSNAAAAGLSVRTAIEMASDELDEPARSELRHTAEAMRLGQPFEEAMVELRDRLPSRELAVLVSTLAVSARAGGSLITALRNIAAALEQRKETRREVGTILGQSMTAGWAIAGMGALLLVGIAVAAPTTMHRMVSSPIGDIILIVSVALMAGALGVIYKITRIDI